jgi:hypothetical protein
MAELKHILEEAIVHLEKSEASDWTPIDPNEVVRDLREAITALNNGRKMDKRKLEMHFLPTSSIQEIAMSNGWSDEYLVIAGQFDIQIKNEK